MEPDDLKPKYIIQCQINNIWMNLSKLIDDYDQATDIFFKTTKNSKYNVRMIKYQPEIYRSYYDKNSKTI
jgi:hypothetical protein